MQKASRSHDSLFKSAKSHKETFSLQSSGWREGFSPETREELLQRIQTQNQLFPVRRFFSLLLEHQSQSEKSLNSRGSEATAARPTPVSEKRKQDTEFLHDDHPPKCQRWNRDAVSVNVPQNPDQLHIKPASRSRLSVSRRKKQQSTPPPAQSVYSAGETTPPECVLREDDVLWTEKYQPQCSEEIIGNSAAMRKLHSWLKEWRMRADVEERRKRQEERRRMQEESKESWDCGDFEGEMVMVDSEAELCNTVLIQGPAGAGKTAAVYACAQELGYKVFEVNSSSLRSGQIVLSQLREATQSHQVGVLQSGSTKPQNSHSTDPPAASTVASRKDASRKLLTSTTKTSVSSRNAPRKKSAAPPAVTLKNFFKRTNRPVDKSTDRPQDPNGSDETKPDVIIESDSNAKDSGEEHVLNAEDRKNRTPPISLILFEEVDIIFSEDVGLLTAIKTLMTTTKRPIILTTNDPLFSKTFDGRFEEVRFKTPPVETTRSYLQCLCLVESVWLDPDDLSVLLAECEGDVRRSVLELELWTRSGGGKTRRHIQNTALTCGSWAELESTGCLDVLMEIWRTGRSLFYSNLNLLFAPLSRTSQNTDKNTSEVDSLKFKEKLEKEENSPSLNETRPGKLSRLKVKKHKAAGDELKMTHSPCSKLARLHLDIFNQSTSPVKCQSEHFSAEESSSKLVSCCLESLAQFFDTMSFLDSCIYKQQLQVPGQCQSGPQGWMGAKLTDSLVDELREEEVNPHLECSYELLAVLESLGFHQCRGELSETLRKAEKLKEVMGGERFTHLMEHLILSESADASASQKSKPGADQKSKEVINKVLSSKAFRCHSNKNAVAVDYLPVLRCICRMERAKQQNRPRFLHYLSDIRLPLPKSTLKLLALDLH
ncbi:ATPase family AAA domain-containing protein 5b [Colossoma macropomum]|uniref:ATPase family AAA domain-containing protein 5b n=1 Tax=Colossoma macropomum TaxID=42526 RepID=UPI001865267F|nr:ATPase family AAA domain-containing protein 5b [Colossoma macropomum]